jgi:hypothetical protein
VGPNQVTTWTVTAADEGEITAKPVVFDGSNVDVVKDNRITFAGAHGFARGEAVIYSSGGDNPIGGLDDGGRYYVVKTSDDKAIKLASDPARKNVINLQPAPGNDVRRDKLTPVISRFKQIGNLTGGTDADTFTLTAAGSLTGAIDGGKGSNVLQGPDAVTKWSVTERDKGKIANANDQSLITKNFVKVGSLSGGSMADTFTLLVGGSLSGLVDGGKGLNTVVGPDVDTSWIAFDQAHNRTDGMVPFNSAARTIDELRNEVQGFRR